MLRVGRSLAVIATLLVIITSQSGVACLECRCFFRDTGWTSSFKKTSVSECRDECIDNGVMCSPLCIPTIRFGTPQVLKRLPPDQCPGGRSGWDPEFVPCGGRGVGILRC